MGAATEINMSSTSRIAKPLGRKRRGIAILFLALGLCSFFEPLIKVDPAVMNRTRWSPFTIARELYQGNLAHSVSDVLFAPLEVGGIYLLFLAALIAVLSSRSQKFVLTIGAIGAALCLEVFDFGDIDFERLFYGFVGLHRGVPETIEDVMRRSVDIRGLEYVLLLVCGVLVFLCLHENMDDENLT
jgi:hypothetical protein